MTPTIRPFDPADRDSVVSLSLRAWAPAFASMKAVLGSEIYAAQYPGGWEASQEAAVGQACNSDSIQVWVAEADGVVTGFVAAQLHEADSMGEIYMLAVDPAYQRHGIAAKLIACATDWIADRRMTVVMVETGGDPGHAPARATYERAGFTQFPISRYFKVL
jgi:ribosomal protein S18 acetylase RimI-like enzyme